MGYYVVDPEEIEPSPDRPCDHRSVSAAVGLTNVGVNVYQAAPGEQLPHSYHIHEEQEEIFLVLNGALSVETPDGVIVVSEGQLFVTEPESPHRAFNPEAASQVVKAVTMGTPAVDDVHPYDPEQIPS
jgi:uncharacterized cupin superfamily protein